MRPKSSFYASENLRRLYRERVGDSMTQKEFARRHKIGGQSMVAMILSGAKPLPIESAPKIAKALRCSIYEICPQMAEFISDELVPALGKSMRRGGAAMLALVVTLPTTELFAALRQAGWLLCQIRKRISLVREVLLGRYSFTSGKLRSVKPCRGFASTTSAWLMRFTQPSGRASAARRPPPTAASACSWPISQPILPMSTQISLRPFATH